MLPHLKLNRFLNQQLFPKPFTPYDAIMGLQVVTGVKFTLNS